MYGEIANRLQEFETSQKLRQLIKVVDLDDVNLHNIFSQHSVSIYLK